MDFIVALFELLAGLAVAFAGRNIYKSMPWMGGFLIGGVIGATLVRYILKPPPENWWVTIAGFLVIGLIGALIARPLYLVIIVLTSCAFGALVGAVLGFIVNQQGVTRMIVDGIFKIPELTPGQLLLMVTFGIAFGAISLRFDDFMTMASTAYVGSFITTTGATGLLVNVFPVFNNEIFLIFFWLIVGTAGMITQNQSANDLV